MEWPARSPDIKPIENIFIKVVRFLPVQALTNECQAIPKEVIIKPYLDDMQTESRHYCKIRKYTSLKFLFSLINLIITSGLFPLLTNKYFFKKIAALKIN